MIVKKGSFPFTFDHRKYTAHVSMFTPVKTPIVRVWLEVPYKPEPPTRKKLRIEQPDVFVFYKLKPGELFWLDLHGRKQAIAQKLAQMLLA